ncbi:MAG TPA: hypothetical protein VJ464_14835 [Blastocatellia bacterium]|nr:hypothetical protein [Blastocatellia bacterium]
MANLSKKVLQELFKEMLAHVPSPEEMQADQYQLTRIFSGDESYMRISAEGMPPLEMRADPAGNLGPAFYLVNGDV